ncbi:MAG: glycoside hydrolase family 2, partial [Lewinellaceae bacterium]|nr:glycoside hydrolase family 2 [Lewinellaceae bacterium]
TFAATLSAPATQNLPLKVSISGEDGKAITLEKTIPAGEKQYSFDVSIPTARLWSLEDPHLYQVQAQLGSDENTADQVKTYFGMREISVTTLPGTDFRYVSLNGRPVYLQLALDQAYHPEGFYTFPTDEFIRDEVLRARQIGLNGLRIHVKVGQPRKLYWADRLGVLIMADVPNSWGEPDAEMRRESEHALRGMIQRDYNHPSIFSWVTFNETWGLFTTTDKEKNERRYLPETKKWVEQMVALAKTLDPTRLVEDNSPCCGIGHTMTDLNSWHSYLPGWEWEKTLAQMDTATYPGSSWNFEEGYRQGEQPNINSEFGNVWGYEGSTGDVDWSWDYHRAINAFRRHPRIAGWLYTEHHDVVNEWNGYWRYDRSEKETGLGELVPGMSLRDLHSPMYISTGGDLSRSARAGEQVEVPLFASFFTRAADLGDSLLLRAKLYGWDFLGRKETYSEESFRIPYHPWMQGPVRPAVVKMPGKPAVSVLALSLEDATGKVHHRNFTTFIVEGNALSQAILDNGRRARLLRTKAGDFSKAKWSIKQWEVLDGKKVNGAGYGFFEYRFPWPEGLQPEAVESAGFLVEASAKQLFGKDRDDKTALAGDYMRGEGTFDPSRNPNAYPMTDETPYPSAVRITANGYPAGRFELPDDPADHRGILSWHAQLKDRKLREAGSYGYLLRANIPADALQQAAKTGELLLRLTVEEGLPGGLAIYGAEFGRYPVEPTVVLVGR